MNELQTAFDCDAPVALVTGSGAPRVGRAIALELARHGCRIALHAHTSVDEANAVATSMTDRYGTESIVTQGALDCDQTPERLVAETRDAFGRLDILVNSAAIWTPTPIQRVTPDELRDYFQINTIATFLCARAAANVMADQKRGGSIVNLGDWATVRPYLDHAAYFPSKGAVDVLTRSLAVEFAQRNPTIRVNCIKPGPVLLDGEASDERRRKLCASTLSGQIGTAEHIAHAVRLLCENSFINGVCLPVDGGRSIFAPDGLQVGENTG
ncbi:SDR family oxidoreductase [Roseiconus nitratireducens]|uniref:SDR family oxidoreductase n=1 Tax=Roseiconus nitratireducens TaxID=2605748 RepID=A0A5M6D0T3_9BACT|nr:SDR family oxidoreductase [Roseiconus nitratireducens]KAA5541091.1 SDR family oxidoreductase [Roseiconus nitratireducens]